MLWGGERGQNANEDSASKRSLVPSLGRMTDAERSYMGPVMLCS
jgi:hypothetical protein